MEIKKALKEFGTYSYNDKGPDEVMDMSTHINKLKALPVEECKSVLLELAEGDRYEEMFVGSVLISLDNEVALFDLMMEEEKLAELY